jgi:hypothetical protein
MAYPKAHHGPGAAAVAAHPPFPQLELATLGVVQQARRWAGLEVSDRIRLTVDAPEEVVRAARAHEVTLAGETLADAVAYQPVEDGGFDGSVGDGVAVRVAARRAGA